MHARWSGNTTIWTYTLKTFRWGSVDHLIAKFPKPYKYDKKKKDHPFQWRGKRALQKESENSDNDNDQKIYASMPQMSGDDEISSKDFGYSLQFTNCILDSKVTCNMTQQVSGLSQVH